jgi:hypothetical protein
MATRAQVLFLGAGASRPFGIPMTAEILPQILKRLSEGVLFTEPAGATARAAREAREDLREGLAQLVPGLFGDVEPPLITDLLSLLDQLLVEGHAGGPRLPVRALDRTRALLEQATAEVLVGPPPEDGGRAARNRPLLDALVDWIAKATRRGQRLSIITTNYDVVLQQTLFRRIPGLADGIDFGLAWRRAGRPGAARPRPHAPRLGVYKLHGSLDWLRCPLCGHVSIEPGATIFRDGALGRAGGRACACGYRPLRHLIVAPSTVREIRDPNLRAIWQSALEALRTASAWTVIGYSMPPEDMAIRTLLLRAYAGAARKPRIAVIERGANAEVENRYRLLFPDLAFEEGGVEGFVGGLNGRPRARRSTPRPAPRARPEGPRQRPAPRRGSRAGRSALPARGRRGRAAP